jgi:hypothetical protein
MKDAANRRFSRAYISLFTCLLNKTKTIYHVLLSQVLYDANQFLRRGLKSIRAQQAGAASSNGQMDLLRDSDQPFVYDINFSKKSFTLEIYDTASPNQHWTTLRPDVVLLAFDISNRETLDGLKRVSPNIEQRMSS